VNTIATTYGWCQIVYFLHQPINCQCLTMKIFFKCYHVVCAHGGSERARGTVAGCRVGGLTRSGGAREEDPVTLARG
jgi:hypothetical protein